MISRLLTLTQPFNSSETVNIDINNDGTLRDGREVSCDHDFDKRHPKHQREPTRQRHPNESREPWRERQPT